MIKLNSRALLCIILSALISQTGQMMAASSAMAQAPEDDIGKLFEDEGDFEEPPGVMNQVPPPPPPPPSDFGGGNPSAGFPPEPAANDFGGGGSSFPTPTGSHSKSTGPVKVMPKAKKGNVPPISTAGIEDITDENYPDLIESFDYPNAEITDIIKAIGQLTGKNFIIDPGVHGKISIIAPTQISVAEAYKAFLSALAINGFTVVQSGKFLKVKNARNAQRDAIETYSGKYYPNADIMITRIVHLKYTSAEEVNKRLRILPSKDGDMTPYEPTNSLIISDYGTNVERMMKIINEIDRPGFEEQLAVMPVRHAKSKDLADLINQIINKETTRGGGGGGGGFGGPAPSFGAGVPRFRGRGGAGGSGGAEELSLVAPDDRTNAIIVVGNATGIQKVRDLLKKLDYKLDPAEAGGVFVYYVRYGEAEKIEATLNGLAGGGTNQSAPGGGGGFGGGFGGPVRSPLGQQQIFGGDVKIKADKSTNSLVITASKQDYETVLNILAKLDIRKDQVFVEAIIMEMNNQKRNNWTPTYYKILPGTNGIARSGFNGGNLAGAANPGADSGAVLGFGTGDMVDVTIGGVATKVPSLLAFINLLQQNTESNILSTPHILALDNEDAEIEVGDQIPIGQETQTTGATTTNSPRFDNASVKLKITPFIRPDSNTVRMKVDQSVKQPIQVNAVGTALAASTTSMSTRSIKTNINVQSGDTAVLGGLVRDSDTVTEKKVPILGDIPVLGWLFKAKTVETQKINLVVFLTPKILRGLNEAQQNVGKVINRRIDWMKKNFGGRDPYGSTVDALPRASQAEANAESSEPISSKSNVRK
jgi:general secretion pathway protein D